MDILPSAANAALEPSPSAPTSTPPSTPGPSFRDVLTSLAQRMDSGEQSVQAALTKAPGSGPAGELLALQASVYRYTETFELAAKLVDKATNGVKTVLQAQ